MGPKPRVPRRRATLPTTRLTRQSKRALIGSKAVPTVNFTQYPIANASSPSRKQAKRPTRTPSHAFYEPLDSLNKEIRLLGLHAGSGEDEITCDIHTTSLKESPLPEYAALSYEWGSSDSQQRCIKISGEAFLVRENLYNALSCIRSPNESQWLWIDAICIDQQNIPERNHQVEIMGEVYSRAALVRVWLGTPLEPQSAKSLFAAFSGAWANGIWRDPAQLIEQDSVDKPSLASDGSRDRPNFERKPWSQLMYASYWERIWIVQEYVLAKRIVIHLGSEAIEGEVFDGALNKISDLDSDGRLKKPRSPAEKMSRHRSAAFKTTGLTCVARRPRDQTLANLLDAYCYSKATDGKDMIYALLYLANDVSKDEFVIDYNKSNFEVFYEVAVFLYPKCQGDYNPFKAALEGLENSLKLTSDTKLCQTMRRWWQRLYSLPMTYRHEEAQKLAQLNYRQVIEGKWSLEPRQKIGMPRHHTYP